MTDAVKRNARVKIEQITKTYRDVFAWEYEQFRKGMRVKQNLQHDKYATVKGNKNPALIRALTEIPETLDTLLRQALEEEEIEYLHSLAGQKWFARKNKDFSLPDEI